MATLERKRKRKSPATSSRQLMTQKSSSVQEWTVPSLTPGQNHFHFDGSTGDRPQCFLVTSGSNPSNTTSNIADGDAVFVLSCHWYDQGWGDRQGRILVVEQERPLCYLDTTRLLSSIPFANGRLVAMSALAEHSKRTMTLSFRSKPNKMYQFWAIVGGGGYNQLHLEDLTLRNHVQIYPTSALPEPIMFQPGLDTGNSSSSFLLAPLDVKRKIVSFLSPVDVVHLMGTSKIVTSELAISQAATFLLGKENQQARCTNSTHPSCFAVYVPKRAHQLHSVRFQCTVSIPDYGWFCLGPVTVSIVAQKRAPVDATTISKLPLAKGRLVSKRSIVFGNCKTPLTLAFSPKEGECYQLWLSRGGTFVPPTTLGLTIIENPRFRTIGYDDNGTEGEASFLATYIGFTSSTPKAGTARDLELLSNGMGQTIHQLMQFHTLRIRRYHVG